MPNTGEAGEAVNSEAKANEDVELEDFSEDSDEDVEANLKSEFKTSEKDRLIQESARTSFDKVSRSEDENIATKQASKRLDVDASKTRSDVADAAESTKLLERGKEIDNATPAKRWYARWKFWGFVVGAVVGLGGVVISIVALYYSLHPKTELDPDILTDEEKKTLDKFIVAWNALPDHDYWLKMRDYVNKYTPTVNSQIEFMTYTMQLTTTVAVMGTPAQKAMEMELVELFDPAKKNYSDLYDRIVEKTTLTRKDAASAMMLALADIGQVLKMMQPA